jgi:hypothetical protein
MKNRPNTLPIGRYSISAPRWWYEAMRTQAMSEGRSFSELVRRIGSVYLGRPDMAPLPQFLEAIRRGEADTPAGAKQPGRRTDLDAPSPYAD